MLGITPAPRQGIDGYTLGGDIREHRFNPYKENGGTVAAIAGNYPIQIVLCFILRNTYTFNSLGES
jgi:hypothetical protein